MTKTRFLFIVMSFMVVFAAFSQDRDRGDRIDARRPLSSSADAASKISFSIMNETGFTVKSVYVCKQDEQGWGENVLANLLSSQERAVVSVENYDPNALYCIRIQDIDGDYYSKANIKLRDRGTIKMEINDLEF